jgi:hypothetical protein
MVKKFRFGLGTAIIAMCSASGILWVNFYWPSFSIVSVNGRPEVHLAAYVKWGWPLVYCKAGDENPFALQHFSPESQVTHSVSRKEYLEQNLDDYVLVEKWSEINILLNIVLGLFFIVGEVFIIEWWLNRRRLRRQANGSSATITDSSSPVTRT